MGQLRQPEVLGDDRRDRAAGAVSGLIAGDHQIGAFDGAERASQSPTGLHHVRTVQLGVEQVYALVGAHRQRLADRLGGTLGTGGQHGHGALAALFLLDQQRLFDGALVDLVQHGVGGLTIEGEVTGGELALRPCVWDLFDQNHDVGHGCVVLLAGVERPVGRTFWVHIR